MQAKKLLSASRVLTLLLASAIASSYGAAAFARGGGGAPAGGVSSDHMSTQGQSSTNGPNATDRDKGLDRAEDRMSDQGIAHENATNQQHKATKPAKKNKTDHTDSDDQKQ